MLDCGRDMIGRSAAVLAPGRHPACGSGALAGIRGSTGKGRGVTCAAAAPLRSGPDTKAITATKFVHESFPH